MDFNIRQAEAEDYNEISSLIMEVHKLHVLNRPDVYFDVNEVISQNEFEELLGKDQIKVFVVQELKNSSLLAYSIVRMMTTMSIAIIIPKKFAYIDDFCVKAKYKGKGIGKSLFNYIKNYSKDEGAESLQLTVWEFNKPAIGFYKAMGMRERNIRMELEL